MLDALFFTMNMAIAKKSALGEIAVMEFAKKTPGRVLFLLEKSSVSILEVF